MPVKIIAETLEDFKEVEDALKILPDRVKDQIETARKDKHWGTYCDLKKISKSNSTIVLVHDFVTQITNSGDRIFIYSKPFAFSIDNIPKDVYVDYVFFKLENC